MRRALVVVLPLLVAFAGCGGSGLYSGTLYPTTGQVLLADGQPLTGGSVRFIPKQSGLPATGKIAAGWYFLSDDEDTRRGRTGRIQGPHRAEPGNVVEKRRGSEETSVRREIPELRGRYRIDRHHRSRTHATRTISTRSKITSYRLKR